MKVLVFNSGSSSIKYELFDMSDCRTLASGLVERIGESESRLSHRATGGDVEARDALALAYRLAGAGD